MNHTPAIHPPAWAITMTIALLLVFAVPAAAHNEVDVWTNMLGHGLQVGEDLEHNSVLRCEDGFDPIRHHEDPRCQTGIEASFSYHPAGAEWLMMSYWCDYAIQDTPFRAEFELEGSGGILCSLEAQPTQSVEEAEEHEHWYRRFGNTEVHGTLHLTSESTWTRIVTGETHTVSTTWHHTFVRGAPINPVGTLHDPGASDDRYRAIEPGATRYVIEDPDGDSFFEAADPSPTQHIQDLVALLSGGLVTTSQGVQVTQTEDPSTGGLLWTFEHLDGEPFAVDRRTQEDLSQDFVIEEYEGLLTARIFPP